MAVPIAISSGRSGFGPQLSLSYDSGAGNGPFGFGWSLSLPSITRKTHKGLPTYLDALDSDVFILSSAEDLVPEFEKDEASNWVIAQAYAKIEGTPMTMICHGVVSLQHATMAQTRTNNCSQHCLLLDSKLMQST